MNLTLVIFYLIIITFIQFISDFSTVNTSLYLIIVGIVASLIFLWIMVSDIKKRKMLNPIQLFSFGALSRVGVGSLYAGLIISTGDQEVLDTMGYMPEGTLDEGVFIMQASSLLFIIGLFGAQGGLEKKANLNVKPPRELFLLTITMISFIFQFLKTQGFPSLGVFGYVVAMIPKAVLYIFTVSITLSRSQVLKKRIYIILIILIQFWLVRHSHMRETFVFILLPVLLALGMVFKYGQRKPQPKGGLLARYPRKRKKLYTYIMGGILIFFIFMILMPAATMLKRQEIDKIDKAIIHVIKNMTKKTSEGNQYPTEGIFAFPHRMAIIVVPPAIIVDFIKEGVEMEYDPLQNLAAGFIPRYLWPNKPTISRGMWFAQFLEPSEWNQNTSIAMTAPGEIMWAYGWLGLIIGFVVMGFIVGKLWGVFLEEGNRNILGIICMIYISQECIRWFEAEASTSLSLIFLLSIMTYAYSFVFGRKNNNKSQASARY